MSPRALFMLAAAGFLVALSISLASGAGAEDDQKAARVAAGAPAPAEETRAARPEERAAPGAETPAPAPREPSARSRSSAEKAAPPPVRSSAASGVRHYRGAGAWVDQYDAVVYDNPWPALREMRSYGVRTLYLETGSWRLPRGRNFRDLVGTKLVIDQAHKLGMKVVAWYLPGLDDVPLDLRRSRAAVRLRTERGGRFDGFAPDIESQRVSSLGPRNAALMRYSRALRRYVGSRYTLGAIVPDQRSSTRHPGLWPDLPYRPLARLYDVFLPMAYSTFRGRGAAYVHRYTRANVRYVRAVTGRPVHIIGGIDPGLTAAESRAVVRGAQAGGAIGASFYDFLGATDGTWGALRLLAR